MVSSTFLTDSIYVDITFSFGLFCLAVITPLVYFNGDLEKVLDQWNTDKGVELAIRIAVNSVICVFHTYLTLLTVTVAGSDGVNIAGILKDVGLTYVSFMFFSDVTVTSDMLWGLTISFIAAIVFALLKLKNTHSSLD